ncbi:cell wall-active antibiotics response protein LiaF [Oceanobacillus profundus]|uniref:cell wall-active antibiotics response protein LiaF n=1 Tax=Oceanobacillus profundus TaxID=372463 RepID=UPI0026E374E0|nr:cell wall-active antibiotics response protein LiaF [Oceanobacillus profundus]MDO6449170.1 cell wall-active antibiotics response protein LiaF [Oceanobacillus profundus]
MFKRLTTDYFNWILIIGVILLIFEIAFFFGGSIIPALFSALFMYIGWKNFHKLWGKIVFWIALVSMVFSVLNLLAVRFLIIAAIIIFIINYSKSKSEATQFDPILPDDEKNHESILKVNPLFDHKLFDDQITEDVAYQWKDVNIHGAFGDRIIDLSNTVLPNDTAVISIRHVIGNIEIYVPYEVEVSIHHSSVFGKAHILGKHHLKLMNKSIHYQTANYDTAYPRVKIITSLFSGDIEVKRI